MWIYGATIYMYICITLQTIKRLNKLGLCVSHQRTLKIVQELGNNHDATVLSWRDAAEKVHTERQTTTQASSLHEVHVSSNSGGSESTESDSQTEESETSAEEVNPQSSSEKPDSGEL